MRMPGKVVREVEVPILGEPIITDSKQNRMTVEQLLEVHKTLSEGLRHTSDIIWRFAIAIATLQLAPFAFIGRRDFEANYAGLWLCIAFFLSFFFSLMLFRQATERRGFVARMRLVEQELEKFHEGMFQPIESELESFKSVVIARFLAGESFVGFVASFLLLVSALRPWLGLE